MNCEHVLSLLAAYLDHELSSDKRDMVQEHLSSCLSCRRELAHISDIQKEIGSALQRRANLLEPEGNAWGKLKTRLAMEPRPLPVTNQNWISGLIQSLSHLPTRLKQGKLKMNKPFFFSSTMITLALAVVTSLIFNNVKPVSAQTILDRAYIVQTQEKPKQGILHMRYETLFNEDAKPENSIPGTIEDTFYDLASCYRRAVTVNSLTGVVLDVHTSNGTSVYGGFNYDINSSGPLIVYKSPDREGDPKCMEFGTNTNNEEYFDQMRKDKNVELVGQENWPDGKKVYVLRSNLAASDTSPRLNVPSQNIAYFDVNTFQFYGGKQIINQNGKEIIIEKKLFTVYETLPAGTAVKWDLEDVKGIQIVDDPDGSHYDDGARG